MFNGCRLTRKDGKVSLKVFVTRGYRLRASYHFYIVFFFERCKKLLFFKFLYVVRCLERFEEKQNTPACHATPLF